MSTTKIPNQRGRAYEILFGSLVSLFFVGALLSALLPEYIGGLPRTFIIVAVVGSGWAFVLIKLIPRCPHCGLGYFSVVEIKRFPILARSWVGSHCAGCGKELK